LDTLLDRTLQNHYLKVRDALASTFQKPDSSWKDFTEVKDSIADNYFATVIKAIQSQENGDTKLTGNTAAARRLLPHVKNVKAKLEADPIHDEPYVRSATNAEQAPISLDQQWLLEKRPFSIERSNNSEQFNTVEALELDLNAWSKVINTPNGAIFFYQKLESPPKNHDLVLDKTHQAQQLLSNEAQRLVASQLIDEFKSKHAISLDFMDQSAENSLE
jgi:hypothetical protein